MLLVDERTTRTLSEQTSPAPCTALERERQEIDVESEQTLVVADAQKTVALQLDDTAFTALTFTNHTLAGQTHRFPRDESVIPLCENGHGATCATAILEGHALHMTLQVCWQHKTLQVSEGLTANALRCSKVYLYLAHVKMHQTVRGSIRSTR